MVKWGKTSYSFARHFDFFYKPPSPHILKHSMDFEILQAQNSISSMKLFGTMNCQLCMSKRIHIIERLKREPTKLINYCTEIFSVCRQRTVIHKLCKKSALMNPNGRKSDRLTLGDSRSSSTTTTWV